MANVGACAGLCFFDHRLFYAVGSTHDPGHIHHIGTVDFNFPLAEALFTARQDKMETLQTGVHKLIDRFNINRLNVLQYPQLECWTTLPKRIYDDAEEREAYISILMNGVKRKKIHASWYPLSNRDFKLLRLRTDNAIRGLKKLTRETAHAEFFSSFEIDEKCIAHSHSGGSGLIINRLGDCISVCSFILGKLRGVTYIRFDDLEDLPYLWLQKAEDLSWLQGIHEHIYLAGSQTQPVIDRLKPFCEKSGIVAKMNTLEKMKVQAKEQTYSFDLGMAYPAIFLALE